MKAVRQIISIRNKEPAEVEESFLDLCRRAFVCNLAQADAEWRGMGMAGASRGGWTGRRIAWLALLALLLNLAAPGLVLRALPPADLLAGTLCHAGTAQPQDDGQDRQAPVKAACPCCALMAAPALPVPPGDVAALPLPPAVMGSILPRGPPALANLPAETRPPAARAPPLLA